MNFPDILMLVVVLLSLPAFRNPTASALIVYYFVAQGAWLLGAMFSTQIYILLDLTVLAVIYCKPPAHDCWPYHGWRLQLCAAWTERSLWDRIVIAIFPFMWGAYFLPLSDYTRWFALYYLALAQFVAAGGEALQNHLSARSAKAGSAPVTPPPGSQFNAGWRSWGYG